MDGWMGERMDAGESSLENNQSARTVQIEHGYKTWPEFSLHAKLFACNGLCFRRDLVSFGAKYVNFMLLPN